MRQLSKRLLSAAYMLLAALSLSTRIALAFDAVEYVDPFIGTKGGGHVMPGASLPNGVIKPLADVYGANTEDGWEASALPMLGFGQMHDDGTGGSPSMGYFKLLPLLCDWDSINTANCPLLEKSRRESISRINDTQTAVPGTFGLNLSNDVRVDVVAAHHSALYEIDWSQALSSNTTADPILLLDLTNDLRHSYQGGGVMVVDDTSEEGVRRLYGNGSFEISFGPAGVPYYVHFCMDLPGNTSAAFYSSTNSTVQQIDAGTARPAKGEEAGAVFKLDRAALEARGGRGKLRMGVSWADPAVACQYLDEELSTWKQPTAYMDLASHARHQWNDLLTKALTVDVTGVSPDRRRLFYSSLYRTHLAPVNTTGDQKLLPAEADYWQSMYCMFDTFRLVQPLYNMLRPHTQSRVVMSLINMYLIYGHLPDCQIQLQAGYIQGGTNADSILAESYVKGIGQGNAPEEDRVDWELALEAARSDAEVPPVDWIIRGRGGVEARKKLGYTPIDGGGPNATAPSGRSASRHLEYCVNDYGIAEMACGLHKSSLCSHYVNASLEWRNLWDANRTSTDGFTGFVQARYSNGTFDNSADVRACSPALKDNGNCRLNAGVESQFYESNAWQTSFYAPHDMRALIDRMGGDAHFLDRLDFMWDHGYADIGNEPSLLSTHQYNFAAGGYRRTIDRVSSLLDTYFNTTLVGIPGNDDSGTLAAFVVWTHLGLYPVAGTPVYLLSVPRFPSYTVNTTLHARPFVVTTGNFSSAAEKQYITGAMLNGEVYEANWLRHSQILAGGELHLELSDTPNGWGESVASLPPGHFKPPRRPAVRRRPRRGASPSPWYRE